VCREHRAKTDGQSSIEQHHPAGQHNDAFTVPIPANEHAVLSEHQALWPKHTVRNPGQSPLVRIAASLRGWLDIVRRMIAQVERIPSALEKLDALLTGWIGPGWWETMGWDW
jgi:hypothetical protein